MRSFRVVAVTLVAISLCSVTASAQACLGSPSFGVGHLQLAAGASSEDVGARFGAHFNGGSETIFGGVGVGGADVRDANGTSLRTGGTLGYQVPLSASGRTQICPTLGLDLGFGPRLNDGFDSKFSSRSFSFGLSVGSQVARAGRLALVPAVSAGFVHQANIRDGTAGRQTVSDTYGVAGLTLGLVLNDVLALRPSISVPVSGESKDPSFGVGFALNYGGRR